MKKEIHKKRRLYRTFSVLTFLLGVALLIFMINVENELGALPLFLIVLGSVWFTINQVQINK